MVFNHIESADIATLKSIADRLGNGMRMDDNERRNVSHLMWLILTRIEHVEVKEHEDG